MEVAGDNPNSFTQLGAALHFYGVALRFAPTPQAKGKIERRHDCWRNLNPYCLAERMHPTGAGQPCGKERRLQPAELPNHSGAPKSVRIEGPPRNSNPGLTLPGNVLA